MARTRPYSQNQSYGQLDLHSWLSECAVKERGEKERGEKERGEKERGEREG
jgi:hypothetical protein